VSKRWPWPCIKCGRPCFEHFVKDPTLVISHIEQKALNLKCPFDATTYWGYTAFELVSKLKDIRMSTSTKDNEFWNLYIKRLHSAMRELELDITAPNRNARDPGAHLLWHKAIL
jgi:hypothetical protein